VAFHPPIPERKESGGRSSIMSAIIQAEKLGQIALILPCAAFIGWLAGAWIGSKMHQVWPGALGVVFGGAAGLYYVIRMAMDAVNNPANADDKSANDKGGDGKGSGSR
jgi:hypothetical protein